MNFNTVNSCYIYSAHNPRVQKRELLFKKKKKRERERALKNSLSCPGSQSQVIQELSFTFYFYSIANSLFTTRPVF